MLVYRWASQIVVPRHAHHHPGHRDLLKPESNYLLSNGNFMKLCSKLDPECDHSDLCTEMGRLRDVGPW